MRSPRRVRAIRARFAPPSSLALLALAGGLLAGAPAEAARGPLTRLAEAAKQQQEGEEKGEELELVLEKFFPEQSPFGPAARGMSFSADGRWGAYLWRPWTERRHGNDLWLVDTETGETRRVTMVSVLERFQAATRAVAEDRRKRAGGGKADGGRRGARGEDAPAAAAPDPLSGDWEGRITGGEGGDALPPEGIAVELTLELQEDGSVTGTLRGEMADATVVEGSFDRETGGLHLELVETDSGLRATVKGRLKDGTLEAEVTVDEVDGVFRLEAKRTRAGRAPLNGDGGDGNGDGTGDDEIEIDDADKVDDDDAEDRRRPRYGGVSDFTWSPVDDTLLFISAGDIYRFDPETDSIDRLTRTREVESQVAWLPDGSGYTYLRGGSLIRVSFDDTRIVQLDPDLPRDETMSSYRLSPDGRRLAMVATRGSSFWGNGTQVTIVSYRDRFARAREVVRHMPDDAFTEFEWKIYLHEIDPDLEERGSLRLVHTHAFTGPRDIVQVPEWAPDSSRAVFSTFEQSSGLARILESRFPETDAAKDGDDAEADDDAAPEAEDARIVYQFFHHGGPNTPGMIRPWYLADSRRIVFLSEISGFRQLAVLDPLYEQLDQLTSGRFELYPIGMSRDHARLFALGTREHPAEQHVYMVDLESGELERLVEAEGYWDAAGVSDDGRFVLANHVDFASPRELQFVAVEDGERTTLTASHGEDAAAMTAFVPEYFSYENRHGHEIHGHMFRPDDWEEGQERPLLVYVYGGPLGMRKMITRGAFAAPSYYFAYYMAKKHGYVTVTIDPRGASGFSGVFEKANFERVGKPQVEDLVDGVRWLVEHAAVDPKRVAIHGWSFGGFQTQMCMFTEPDVFQVGIAGAGPTEWENYNSWYSTGTIGNSRTGSTDLEKFSLLPLAKNLRGRLLLVHGMEDSNVLYQDTVRVYRALLQAGKEALVDLFLDPSGGHGLGGDVKTINRYRKYEDFVLLHNGRADEVVEREASDEAAGEAEKEGAEDAG